MCGGVFVCVCDNNKGNHKTQNRDKEYKSKSSKKLV